MEILTLSHVKKTFGSAEVLRDVSIAVPEHSVFGFIGQNGAGKTTTMKLALGLLKPEGGDIRVNGEPVVYGQNRTNRYIGYLPDVPEFYGFMTPAEYLTMCGEVTGMGREEIRQKSGQLLKLVGLEAANKRIKGFSRGMKQRLGIAQALLNSPKLLICDEPTSALDPAGRKEILEVLHAVREQTTVLFSTHILSDVERICDRIAFLHEGRIVLNGTLEEMKAKRKGRSVALEFVSAAEAERFLQLYGGGTRESAQRIVLENRADQDAGKLWGCLQSGGFELGRLERMEPTLEDLFMEVTGG
ncbi:MAG: ABC transporter ATP-binding protein [Clostridium sp.]|nr:ABC transporter ATP-binding protein [Clostridium sp.]